MGKSIQLYLTDAEWIALCREDGALLGQGRLAPSTDWLELGQLARELDLAANQPVHVIVGGERCHFLTLPWSDVLMDEKVGPSYVEGAFFGLYGAPAANWEVVAANAAYGRPRLACATDRALFAAIESLAGEGLLRLASVRPSVMAIYERIRPQLVGERGVLGFIDGAEGCSLVRWEDHEVIEAIHLRRSPGHSTVIDWHTRTELDLGPLGTRYWLADGDGQGPQEWQCLAPSELPRSIDPATSMATAFWSR